MAKKAMLAIAVLREFFGTDLRLEELKELPYADRISLVTDAAKILDVEIQWSTISPQKDKP